MAQKWGDGGDWTVVRSRKRKATQPEAGRRDRSTVSERHGGRAQTRGREQRATDNIDRRSRYNSRSRNGVIFTDARVSFNQDAKNKHVDRRDSGKKQVGAEADLGDDYGSRVSFYFTNFPDLMPVFWLRQFFEVCGMLSDVYIARMRNFRGQAYGFLRFMNVRNKDKLALALNNVWIGHCRIWAREARFDRFAWDKSVLPGVGRFLREEGKVVVRVRDEGVKNVRVGNMVQVENGEGDQVLEGKRKEECVEDGEGVCGVVAGAAVRTVEMEGEGGGSIKANNVQVQAVVCNSQLDKGSVRFIPRYNSTAQDRNWATSGMVSTVISGDSTLSLQQCVEDAGFNCVVVTPMGGDRVFLSCTGGEDIWHVFNNALHFFGMLFSNIHMWSVSDVRYEWGAWLRVYGVPVHAWNDAFFKLCVTGVGRFVRTDECTTDKARLDFAHILISTSQLEILNTSSDILIDGSLYSFKMVEEWGCNLGEDAF